MAYAVWVTRVTRPLALIDAWYRHYEARRDAIESETLH